MNTKMMEQFEIMDAEMLACVEGGDMIGEEQLAVQRGLHTVRWKVMLQLMAQHFYLGHTL